MQEAKEGEGIFNQYISMLKFYIKKKPKPSWSGIVSALQSSPMECHNLRLADLPQEVQDQVKAGKLPCENTKSEHSEKFDTYRMHIYIATFVDRF